MQLLKLAPIPVLMVVALAQPMDAAAANPCANPTIQVVKGQLVNGTLGPDVIRGSRIGESIAAGDGNDTVCAGRGDDQVEGSVGDDRLNGNGGNDQLWGEANNSGEGGADKVSGGRGNDKLTSAGGIDLLAGGGGDDEIDARENGGVAGQDTVKGGKGNDAIRADDGDKDVIDCGGGADKVWFDKGLDTIAGCEAKHPV